MSDGSTPDGVLDTLARYAPTPSSVSAEWSDAHRIDVLADIIGDRGDVGGNDRNPLGYDIPGVVPARSDPRRYRGSKGLSVAASVVVLAVAAVAVVAAIAAGSSDSAGPPNGFNPPASLSGRSLGPGQYSYRVDEQIDLGADGSPKPHGQNAMLNRNWVSPNGDIVSIRTGSQRGCFTFPHSGSAGWGQPTQSFFDSLPTSVDALNAYLRKHVHGSSSRDEAVFVAVGDALRTADGLAAPRLRGALVGVLSRTAGVHIHSDQRDYLGHAAVRADFVDQRIRPGEIHSMYFDPATFQLLEERFGSNAQPQTYDGPSPAYNAAPGPADDPNQLSGAAFIDVMISEKVVDKLPTIPRNCKS